jgi:hypothetical protein
VVDEVVSHIGDQYDRRQLVDLGRYLTPFHLLPGRWRQGVFSGQSDSRADLLEPDQQAFLGVAIRSCPCSRAAWAKRRPTGSIPGARASAARIRGSSFRGTSTSRPTSGS